MWLTWVMILLAIAMVVGPVMMIQPTPGMSKLARLRSLASKEGMNVRLSSKSPGNKGAIYSVPLSEVIRDRKPFIEWKLVKKNHSHELHFSQFWDWDGESRPEDSVLEPLGRFLESVPDGLTSFDCNIIGVGCMWDEFCRGKEECDAVREIKDMLFDLRKVLE